jgi:hypothetical protein
MGRLHTRERRTICPGCIPDSPSYICPYISHNYTVVPGARDRHNQRERGPFEFPLLLSSHNTKRTRYCDTCPLRAAGLLIFLCQKALGGRLQLEHMWVVHPHRSQVIRKIEEVLPVGSAGACAGQNLPRHRLH